jgi:hypothetical protein
LALQAWLHMPQWPAFVVMLVSQPSAALQSAKPEAQAPVHVPFVQIGVGTLLLLHVFPHPPQFATDVLILVSQPFGSWSSQSPYPELQVKMEQIPMAHVGVAFGGEQATPQPPQFEGVLMFVSHPSSVAPGSLPSQFPKPEAHVGTHRPALHARAWVLLVEQAASHAPQWATEIRRSRSHPLVCSPSQLPQPELHVTTWHVPAPPTSLHAHVATLGPLQINPQDPQFDGVVTSVSQS